ncbi:MAG: ABC transporter permease [Deltaproteobacteria bacterium]|nr:ABC transporter permease [Deltaproteobacteria bacterium]
MRQLVYFLRQAFNNIRNNRLAHFIGMSTMGISILILGAFALLYVNIYEWVQSWGGSVSMSVYLKDEIEKADLDRIEQFIKKHPELHQYHYISKEKALQELKDALGEQSKFLSVLSTNPLPASFEVEITTSKNHGGLVKELAQEIRGLQGVEEVQYSQAWIERFKGTLDMIRVIGFIVGGLLALGALFIVTNTIKLTIYSRKEEIEILKLVGATDWFVKAPFVVEGMIQGVFSALVAMATLYGGFLAFSAKRAIFLNVAVINLQFIPWSYVVTIVVLSFLVGAVGSLIAVGSFFEMARS